MVTTTPVKCCQEVFGPENKYSCVLAVACMRTSETATNLPVLTDRELIRIILHQKKNVITVTEKKKTFIVHVSFCLEGVLGCLKFLLV